MEKPAQMEKPKDGRTTQCVATGHLMNDDKEVKATLVNRIATKVLSS